MEISERIRKVFEKERLTYKGFCEKNGFKYRTMQSFLKGRSPNVEFLILLNEKLKISIDWLLTGKGSMYFNEQLLQDYLRDDAGIYASEDDIDTNEFASVKLYNTPASAGFGAAVENQDFKLLWFRKTWFAERQLTPTSLVAVNIKGDSNIPVIEPDSIVLADTVCTELKNGQFYVFNVGDDLLIKEIHVTLEGEVIAKSKNPAPGYDDIVIDKTRIQDLNIVGRAKRVLIDRAL